MAIVGKSGSGKSTLMHILACLDRPTSGTFLFEGENINKLRSKELDNLRNHQFRFVFQHFFMNANDSVLDNVALPLKIAGISQKERRRRALKILSSVDLSDKAKSKAKDLSGGQKQRVCIARALVTKPSIILADEPTGNLDSKTGVEIMRLFEEIWKQGNTVILVTHEDDIARHARRIIRVRDGLVESDLVNPNPVTLLD